MMKKEVKVERNRLKSTEGAHGVNRTKENAEEEGEINKEKGRMERRDTKVRWLEKHVAVKLGLDPRK